jgi:hypothetical protein
MSVFLRLGQPRRGWRFSQRMRYPAVGHEKVDMAKPTKDDKTRRRAVKAARKVDKERAKQTRQEHDGEKDFGQSIGGSEKDGPEGKKLQGGCHLFCNEFQFTSDCALLPPPVLAAWPDRLT